MEFYSEVKILQENLRIAENLQSIIKQKFADNNKEYRQHFSFIFHFI